MRASEWQFLCAVHEQPKSCCAIDYCCHTLDWAANVVTDQKIFASRLVALSDTHNKNMAMKNLVNVFRRLHRIFAHAWFQHRSVFWSVEGQTGLYVFFKRVCDMYDLIPGETYKLPPEAEGLEPEVVPPPEPAAEQKAEASGLAFGTAEKMQEGAAAEEDHHGVGRTNTRRHIRSNPSTGSAVTTVIEADEDEGAELARKTREMHISGPPEPLEEEPEAEDVPVIVEDSVIYDPSGAAESPTDDAETPVQPSANVPAEAAGGDQTKESSSGVESEAAAEAPAAESQAESEPMAEEPAPTAEEAGEPDKPAEEDSSATKEEDENDATVKDPFPAEQQEGESTGDSLVSEPVESTPEGKPSEVNATEEPEASSVATDPATDAKSEDPPQKSGNS